MNRNVPAVVVLLAVLGFLISPGPAPAASSEPFLAVYIHFPSLFDAKASAADRERAIARELDRIKACGLNTLLPYATGTSGSASYASDLIPERVYGDWDALAVLMREARRRGLRVYPVHCALPSGSAEPRGILKQHPEWALRNARGEAIGYLSPFVPEAREWIARVSHELVEKYQPDGLLLDYLRFPSEAVQVDGAPVSKDAADRKTAQARKEADLTELARLISTTTRAAKPGLQIALYSWGPHVTTNHSVAQNWTLWIQRGYVDNVNVSGYCFTNNYGARYRETFSRRIRDAVALNRSVGRPAQITFALGVKTSHGQIHRADEVADYLKLAQAEGAQGVAVFTWGHLQPFREEVRAADYFRNFAATLEAPSKPPGSR